MVYILRSCDAFDRQAFQRGGGDGLCPLAEMYDDYACEIPVKFLRPI